MLDPSPPLTLLPVERWNSGRSTGPSRFDAALSGSPRHGPFPAPHRFGQDAEGAEPGTAGDPFAAAVADLPEASNRPPMWVHWIQLSLDQALWDAETPDLALQNLVHHLDTTLQASQRLPSSRWSLKMRINDRCLPSTEVHIDWADPELRLALRTANEDAYRTMTQSLPQLQASLLQRRAHPIALDVFLIAPEDLA